MGLKMKYSCLSARQALLFPASAVLFGAVLLPGCGVSPSFPQSASLGGKRLFPDCTPTSARSWAPS
jgi:hypothetical protein